MKGNSLMEWMVKLIFGLMLLPFFLCLAGQLFLALFQAIGAFLFALFPWVFALAVLIALFAGLGAGIAVRRRLPRQNGNRLPPGGVQPVRRPRGPGRDDED
jgi:uncharacterized protein (DUF58 family)